jgi:hypothetical protein
METEACTMLQGTSVTSLQRLYLRILLVGLVTLAYAALWTINTSPLAVREHFYQNYFSFPASSPQAFGDLRYYLIWLDCVRAGAPTDKPCALGSPIPWVYPSAWLLVVHTGLSVRHTIPVAAFLFIGLIAMASYLCAPGSVSEVFYDALFLVSPPFILALERCNMDILIFILLGLAVVFASRRATLGAFGLVWVAALLKVYPGVSLLAFIRKKSDVFAVGIFGATLLAYIEAIRAQLRLLYIIVPQTEYQSFGRPELFLIIGKKLEAMGHPVPMLHSVIPLFALAVFTISIALLALVFVRQGLDMDLEPTDDISQHAFTVGGLVYCACWSLGMNFNYRYMFLAMTLPKAWAWASAKFQWRWSYGTYLLAALTMAWLALFQYKHPWIEIGHALLGWLLYGVLLFTLILLHWRALVTALGKGTASLLGERSEAISKAPNMRNADKL